MFCHSIVYVYVIQMKNSFCNYNNGVKIGVASKTTPQKYSSKELKTHKYLGAFFQVTSSILKYVICNQELLTILLSILASLYQIF